MFRTVIAFLLGMLVVAQLSVADATFDGVELGLGNLPRLSSAKSRSISPENPTGEPGKGAMATVENGTAGSAARDLGQGWKVNPYIDIGAGETRVLADIKEGGVIQQIWMTPTGTWRFTILRIFWDNESTPSVEVPVGDFFGMGWGKYAHLNSLAVNVNPGSAFNSFWPMPFRKAARIEMQNLGDKPMRLYYQVNYTVTEVPADTGYFHAQFRRSFPTQGGIHTLVDGIRGQGHYVGTYLAWGVTNTSWWGEGEVKFFMDGDQKFPSILSTGTEDYFLGSYNFDTADAQGKRGYREYSTPYAGLHQVIRPDGLYNSQQRFGVYRWHVMDPVRFERSLTVNVQDLGWREGGRYLVQKSDISSVAYWYQREPHAPFPKLPARDELEVK